MSGSQSGAAQDAMQQNAYNARMFQNLGLPYLRQRNQILMDALQGQGVPSTEAGFNAQRAGMTEGIVGNDALQNQRFQAQSKQAVAGGNTSQVMSGPTSGIASQMAQSRIQQGLAGIEQKNQILQMAMGAGVNTGNQAVQAGGMQMNAIRGLPQYNPWMSGAASVGSGAYGVYGALMNQQGIGGNMGGAQPETRLPWGSQQTTPWAQTDPWFAPSNYVTQR